MSDTITREIIRNRLVASTEEMAKTLIRTAFNPLLYEVQDFGVIIMSATGEMWAETPGVIVFSQGFPEAVRSGVRRWQGKFEPGDALIVNDPFETGTHISDTNVYMPVFFGDELVAFCGVAAHWADVGGKNPGGWSADTTDMYQEGLCFRHQKLLRAGVMNEDIWDLIAANVRVPSVVRGDLEAQIAACRQGALCIQDLCGKYGIAGVEKAMREVIDSTDDAMRRAIGELPDGEYASTLRLDSDGVDPQGRFEVHLKVVVSGDRVCFNLDGTSPVARGPINLPEVGTRGILASSLKGILFPFDPCNAGHTRSINFDIPPDSLVSPARPAPTDSYGYLVVALMELTFRCLARIVPSQCPAGGYQLTGAMFSRSAADGTPFVMADPTHGGNGAGSAQDGPTNQLIGNGDLPNTPVEITETRYPFRVERLEFAPEVAGAGQYRGGKGTTKEYRLLEDGICVAFITESTEDCLAKGVDGGGDGQPGYMWIDPDTATARRFAHRVPLLGPFKAGTLIRVTVGGGGGWGNPLKRDPESVLRDVRNGLLSLSDARERYGVEINVEHDLAEASIDPERTNALRARVGSSVHRPTSSPGISPRAKDVAV